MHLQAGVYQVAEVEALSQLVVEETDGLFGLEHAPHQVAEDDEIPFVVVGLLGFEKVEGVFELTNANISLHPQSEGLL